MNLPAAGAGLCPRAPSRWLCPDQAGGGHSGSGGYVASSGSPRRLRAAPGVELKAFSPKPQAAAGCSPRPVPSLPGHRSVFSARARILAGRPRLCPWPAAPPLPSPGTVPGKSLDCGAVALLLTCRRCSRAGRLLPRHRFRVSFIGSRWSWKKTSTVLLFPANGLPRLPVIFQA